MNQLHISTTPNNTFIFRAYKRLCQFFVTFLQTEYPEMSMNIELISLYRGEWYNQEE
jgi:hypothetical protein